MVDRLAEPKRPTGKQTAAILVDLGRLVNNLPPPFKSLVWARMQGLHAGLAGFDYDPDFDDVTAQNHYLRGYRVGFWLKRGDE